ncbi:hypothetical protein Tco_0611122 [Tanacetum coccineum]
MQVLDQIVVEEKDYGLHSLGDVTFEQLMDQVDHEKKAAQEKVDHHTDSEKITYVGVGPTGMDLDDSTSGLQSMPDDDLISFDGFKTSDSTKEKSNLKEVTAHNLDTTSTGDAELPIAFAGMSALSNPLGHLRRELDILTNKVD